MKFDVIFPKLTFSYPESNQDKDIEDLGFKTKRDRKATYWLTVTGSKTIELETVPQLLRFLKKWPKARIDQTSKPPQIKMLGFS